MIINRDLIGKKFEDSTFDDFEPIVGTESAIQACRDLIDGKVRGIVLTGPQGRGKSHLLIATIKEYDKPQSIEIDDKQRAIVRERGVKIVFWPHKELTSRLRSEAISGEKEAMWMCKGADLLAIDDFGSEKPSEFITEAMEEILDWRYRNEMATAITTNLTMKAISEIYGPRIPSRWNQEYAIARLATKEDYRLKLAAERKGD